MIEIRFYGRGGQGAVVAAKLLAEAAVKKGYHAQSFALYTTERRGGKVECFTRVSQETIPIRCKVYEPDYVILMDDSLARDKETVSGLKNGGIVINSPKPPETFSSLGSSKVVTIDAREIATKMGLLLPTGAVIINTTLLGAFAKASSLVGMEHLAEAIREGGIPAAEKNIKAAQEAYQSVVLRGAAGAVVKEETPEAIIPAQRYPVFHLEKMPRCNRCQICYISCPDLAITLKTNPFSLAINRDLCKRCGICIEECPRHAISWEGEAK